MAIIIVDAQLSALGWLAGRWAASGSASARVPANDITLYLIDTSERDSSETLPRGVAGIPYATAEISGTPTGWFGVVYPLEATAEISASVIMGLLLAGPGVTSNPRISGNSILKANGSIYPQPVGSDPPAFYVTYKRNNVVGWSKIGDTRILLDESQEAGYLTLPGRISGVIHQILPMREKFPIIYGKSGIFLLQPIGLPFATYAMRQLSRLEVYGSGAVCGGDGGHYFVDAAKRLFMVSPKDGMERPVVVELGCAEFIEAITPADEQIVMHYDWRNDRAYLSTVHGGLIITTQGVGGGYAKLTAADGQLFASPEEVTSLRQELCTDVLDMHHRGIKTVMSLLIGADSVEGLEAAVDYKYNKASAFVTSSWLPVNNEGVVFPIIGGVEFRLRIRNLAYEDFRIDYVNVKFKYTDKRFNRGTFGEEVGQ
jgi:hypothetical protein